MVLFKQTSCLYSSSSLFHAHKNFFLAYLHFLQLHMTMIILEGELSHKYINFVYSGYFQESSLTVKYDLGIALYSGLKQDLLLHEEVL